MPSSINAICSDFYVNQKLALKMDLPTRRETVLDMFDRIRREMPVMEDATGAATPAEAPAEPLIQPATGLVTESVVKDHLAEAVAAPYVSTAITCQ